MSEAKFKNVSPQSVAENFGVETALNQKLHEFLTGVGKGVLIEGTAKNTENPLQLKQLSIEFGAYLDGQEEYTDESDCLAIFFKRLGNKNKQALLENWMDQNGYKLSDEQVRIEDEDGKITYSFVVVKK